MQTVRAACWQGCNEIIWDYSGAMILDGPGTLERSQSWGVGSKQWHR